jgi:hypothetical protein
MSESEYLDAESSEGSESEEPTAIVADSVREQCNDGPSIGTVAHVVNAPGVASTAPVLANDVQAPAAVAAASASGRGEDKARVDVGVDVDAAVVQGASGEERGVDSCVRQITPEVS